LIAAGKFRQDLYFRLARFVVKVPPLRDHREDIPLLVDHFLRVFAREMNLPKPTMSFQATLALQAYDFPGNVRELKNIVERSLIESGGTEIHVEHLHFLNPPRSPQPDGIGPGEPTKPAVSNLAPASDEDKILAYVREHGSINNTDCR
jgi:DNA-binding NtrC family response regulator